MNVLLTFILLLVSFCFAQYNPKVLFLNDNVQASGLPNSYMLDPKDYFDKIPEDLRPHDYNTSQKSPQCGGTIVDADHWNAYEFQTERLLSALGLNIYDGAVRAIALSSAGFPDLLTNYYEKVLLPGKTFQLGNIRGDAPCKGVMYWKECSDPQSSGACGLCYGDADIKTLPHMNSFFFRMIGDYWAVAGTTMALCPEKQLMWTWNDWKPVLGENAWSNLLGTLHTAFWKAGRDIQSVNEDSAEISLAVNFIAGVKAMVAGDTGGVYYAPRNTYYSEEMQNIGSTISTENNASLYAGLKALRYYLETRKSSKWAVLLPDVIALMDGVEKFLKTAYSADLGYFRQGATYDPKTKTATWGSGASIPLFAVDCQTWVSSVLGSQKIDAWFGNGTTLRLWETTKKFAGYAPQPDGKVKGVGFTFNDKDQVFSGEWTYGAINWLRILIKDGFTSNGLQDEVQFMASSIVAELKRSVTMPNGDQATGFLYANKRYFIPFGWWANPLPSLASTSWSILYDNYYNPFMLTGEFTTEYSK